MANLFIQNIVGGGILLPTVTWSNRSTAQNGVTTVTTYKGKCTAFTIREELAKLYGVQTRDGIYKDHSLSEGGGQYDDITINFQKLVKSPTYLYTYKGPTQSFPLEQHPGYFTYWNHNIVKADGTEFEMSSAELASWQDQRDGTIPTVFVGDADLKWEKWSQAQSKAVAATTDATAPDSGWNNSVAKKRGVNSFVHPVISVTETIYFLEPLSASFYGITAFGTSRVGVKEVAALNGRAGWPKNNTFGYPKTVADLLTADYAEYRKSGYALGSEQSDFDATFFTDRGIPTDYPLWLCKNAAIKKVGNWYEATLTWQYSSYSVDADLYPLATARIAGYI